jgi:hypothetical protein
MKEAYSNMDVGGLDQADELEMSKDGNGREMEFANEEGVGKVDRRRNVDMDAY